MSYDKIHFKIGIFLMNVLQLKGNSLRRGRMKMSIEDLSVIQQLKDALEKIKNELINEKKAFLKNLPDGEFDNECKTEDRTKNGLLQKLENARTREFIAFETRNLSLPLKKDLIILHRIDIRERLDERLQKIVNKEQNFRDLPLPLTLEMIENIIKDNSPVSVANSGMFSKSEREEKATHTVTQSGPEQHKK